MTLNDLERPFDVKIRFRPALCCSIGASFGAHCTNLNEARPIDYQRQKCRPMNLVSENIRFMWIFAGVPLGGGVKRHWGLSTTAIFGNLGGWLRLRKFQRYDTQYYMTICYLLSTGKWLQNEWPWMTLSGYFMTKCVFGQHFLNQSVWM